MFSKYIFLHVNLVLRLLTHGLRSLLSNLHCVDVGVDLVGDANDTASRARAGVTSLLGLLVSALAEVVGAGVDDDGALAVY
jgi:hypothetical protein